VGAIGLEPATSTVTVRIDGKNVSPSKPGDQELGGFGISALVLEVDAGLAQLDDRRAAPADRVGESGSVNGIPFGLRSGLPSRTTR
jgi:hypothetical protein